MALFTPGALGIDLGTSRTTIYAEGRGLCLSEPSLLLVSQKNAREILAVGGDAFEMLGRASVNIATVEPIVSGAVTDVDMAALLMLALSEKALGKRKPMEKLQVIISMAAGVTTVEQAALKSAAAACGAKRPILMRTPIAAALGAGLNIDQPRGQMVVDIGAGTIDIAVLSMGGIAASRSLRFGGQQLDEAVARYFRREKNLIIGLRTAEELKCDIGTAVLKEEQGDQVTVHGMDATTGLPHALSASSRDVCLALQESLYIITDAVRQVLEDAPADLTGDILENDIVLTGCGSLLHGLDALLKTHTGVETRLADHPADCAALGVGALASDIRMLERALLLGTAEE